MIYQFEIEIPDWPVGYYIGIAVAAWYLFAYIIVRVLMRTLFTSKETELDPMGLLLLWAFSPVLFSIYIVVEIVTFAVECLSNFLFPSAPRKEKK